MIKMQPSFMSSEYIVFLSIWDSAHWSLLIFWEEENLKSHVYLSKKKVCTRTYKEKKSKCEACTFFKSKYRGWVERVRREQETREEKVAMSKRKGKKQTAKEHIFITEWGEGEEGRQQDWKSNEGGGRELGGCEGGLWLRDERGVWEVKLHNPLGSLFLSHTYCMQHTHTHWLPLFFIGKKELMSVKRHWMGEKL